MLRALRSGRLRGRDCCGRASPIQSSRYRTCAAAPPPTHRAFCVKSADLPLAQSLDGRSIGGALAGKHNSPPPSPPPPRRLRGPPPPPFCNPPPKRARAPPLGETRSPPP